MDNDTGAMRSTRVRIDTRVVVAVDVPFGGILFFFLLQYFDVAVIGAVMQQMKMISRPKR